MIGLASNILYACYKYEAYVAVNSGSSYSSDRNRPGKKAVTIPPMDHSAFQSLNSTRLIRLLSGVSGPDTRESRADFAEKFGRMLHFSGSVNLFSALETPVRTDSDPSQTSGHLAGEKIRNQFLTAQAGVVRFIVADFVPTSRRTGNQLPTAGALHAHCELNGVFSAKNKKTPARLAAVFEPYRKFYMSRQRDLEVKVGLLRVDIRDSIAGLSPALAKLAKIDQALSESLAVTSGEAFAVIPKLLEKRFGLLFETLQSEFPENPGASDFNLWMKPGGWLSAFCTEMQELMLAELEVRLQPVVGMIDALPNNTLNTK